MVVRGVNAAIAALAIAVGLLGIAGKYSAFLLGLGACAALFALVPPRFGRRFLLLLGALVLAAAAAEGGLRIVYSGRLTPIYQFHPRYYYRLVPGARKLYVHMPINGGKTVVMQVNSAGFRGPELRAESPNRIVVYGDSYVNGEYSDAEKTFAARLERRLAEAGVKDVEAVNAGVNGYGPDQACLRMEEEVPRLRPKLVVLSLSNNDFGDLLRNKLFKVGADGTVRRNNPRIGERLSRPFRDARDSLFLDRAIQKVLGGLRQEIPVVGQSLLERSVGEYEVYVKQGNDEPEEPFSDHYDADVSMTPDSESARYKVELMAGVLRAAKEAAGAPLVLVLIPAPADLFDVHETGRVDPSAYPAYRRSAMTDAMAEAARRAGVPYVDLFPVFHAKEPESLYFRGGDDHWNDAGQDLAAERMAAYLLSNGLLR